MGPDRIVDKSVDDLLAGCAAGDSRALRDLYDRLSAQLFGIALRILKDRHAAEEVLHDVFIQIWRHAGRLDGRVGSSRTWIISMVRYRAIDRARKLDREVATDLSADAMDMPSAPRASTDAAGYEEVSQFYKCLGALPEKSRRAVALAFLDGLSHEQVAIAVGAPVGTVKSGIRQGLISLRKCLKSHGP